MPPASPRRPGEEMMDIPGRSKRERKAATKAPKQKLRQTLAMEADRVRTQVERLAKQDRPILAGPFTGEVGFELLYWIPLIRWAVREFPEIEDRLVVISRGGTEAWLNGLDVRYVDILSLFPPEDFARHRALSDKQRQVKKFETRVIEAVERELGVADAAVLHPSVLYEAYFRFLKINQLAYPRSLKRGSEAAVAGLTAIYEPIEVPEPEHLPDELPEDYVAVRFYSRDSFQSTPESRAFASNVVKSLRRSHEVVFLGHPFELDEHRDLHDELPSDVISIDHLLRPENNLAIQTAVVGHAKAFVGTYGGFSYLAPFLGVPSLSFSIERARTQSWHYELALGIFDGPGWGDFVALQHTDLSLIELVTQAFASDDGAAAYPGSP